MKLTRHDAQLHINLYTKLVYLSALIARWYKIDVPEILNQQILHFILYWLCIIYILLKKNPLIEKRIYTSQVNVIHVELLFKVDCIRFCFPYSRSTLIFRAWWNPLLFFFSFLSSHHMKSCKCYYASHSAPRTSIYTDCLYYRGNLELIPEDLREITRWGTPRIRCQRHAFRHTMDNLEITVKL